MKPEDVAIAYKNALAPGQPFHFHCDQCGKCCKNREDILLNPYDLYRASKTLGIPASEFISRYCIVYIGESSRLPCVLLKPVGEEKACPLLKNNLCQIHKGKPTVCALYPLGRATKMQRNKDGSVSPDDGFFYFVNNVNCGLRDEEHSVAEWLAEFNLQESEAWFVEWSRVIGEIAIHIQGLEKKLSPHLMKNIFNAVFVGLYLNYEPFGSFLSQFIANSKKVTALLLKIESEIGEGKK